MAASFSSQSWMDWSEQDLYTWMKAVNISAYHSYFRSGGVVRGADLQGVTESRLDELGIVDELHRQIIMECLNELTKGTSSLVSVQCGALDWEGRGRGRGGGAYAISLHTRN